MEQLASTPLVQYTGRPGEHTTSPAEQSLALLLSISLLDSAFAEHVAALQSFEGHHLFVS